MSESEKHCTLEDLKEVKIIFLDRTHHPARVMFSREPYKKTEVFLPWPGSALPNFLTCTFEDDVESLVLPFMKVLTGYDFQKTCDVAWTIATWQRTDTL